MHNGSVQLPVEGIVWRGKEVHSIVTTIAIALLLCDGVKCDLFYFLFWLLSLVLLVYQGVSVCIFCVQHQTISILRYMFFGGMNMNL